MSDFDTPKNEMERAIAASVEAGDDLDGEARRGVLMALATNNVTVVLPPLREDGTPPDDAQPLFVSDGPDREQAMLAAFTSPERARAFNLVDEPCEVREITGSQLILGTPEKVGIMINPNQSLSFRIGYELARMMRGEAQTSFEQAVGQPGEDAPDAS